MYSEEEENDRNYNNAKASSFSFKKSFTEYLDVGAAVHGRSNGQAVRRSNYRKNQNNLQNPLKSTSTKKNQKQNGGMYKFEDILKRAEDIVTNRPSYIDYANIYDDQFLN